MPVHTPAGGTDGTAELPGELFDAPASTALMHQVVTAQLAAARQGTHDTKTRGEVRGGGKKPYRQKGTGRARQGSVRAPQFTGGGTVHGPTPRDYDQRTPKKMKAAALRGALSDRARHERIHVFSALVEGDGPVHQGRPHGALGSWSPRARAPQGARRRRPRGRGRPPQRGQPAVGPPAHARPAQHLRRPARR